VENKIYFYPGKFYFKFQFRYTFNSLQFIFENSLLFNSYTYLNFQSLFSEFIICKNPVKNLTYPIALIRKI